MIHFITGHSQCNQQNIKASGYLNGNCNGLQFQGVIGSISSSFGECGGLVFDSPLSGSDITSSITDAETNYTLSIYPNPTMGILQIESSSNRVFNLALYSSLGQLIMSKTIQHEGISQLSMDHLHAGYYFLKVMESNSKTKILKIIKI
jgi:hypothetical protein